MITVPLLLILAAATDASAIFELFGARLVQASIVICPETAPLDISHQAARQHLHSSGKLSQSLLYHAEKHGEAIRSHFAALGLIKEWPRKEEVFFRSSPSKASLLYSWPFSAAFVPYSPEGKKNKSEMPPVMRTAGWSDNVLSSSNKTRESEHELVAPLLTILSQHFEDIIKKRNNVPALRIYFADPEILQALFQVLVESDSPAPSTISIELWESEEGYTVQAIKEAIPLNFFKPLAKFSHSDFVALISSLNPSDLSTVQSDERLQYYMPHTYLRHYDSHVASTEGPAQPTSPAARPAVATATTALVYPVPASSFSTPLLFLVLSSPLIVVALFALVRRQRAPTFAKVPLSAIPLVESP